MSLLPRDIKEFLAPFKLLVNKNALSPVYRSLEITPDLVRGCAAYAMLETKLKLGLPTPVVIDVSTFLAVIDSLPAEEELKLSAEGGVLTWSCGAAEGKLALAKVDAMPKIERSIGNDAWTVPEGFGKALSMGALSCDSMSLASVGMHGVVLDMRGEDLLVASSDNVTISAAYVPTDSVPASAPDVSTISPEAAALLTALLGKGGVIEFSETELFYRDENTRAVIKQVTPLKHDLASVLANFEQAEVTASIPPDRIAAFIKRVAALSEAKKNTYVTLLATDGHLGLSFAEKTAMSDEYFLAEGLKIAEDVEIELDAARLARALTHVEEVVLDHVGRNAVVFRGEKFAYMVARRG